MESVRVIFGAGNASVSVPTAGADWLIPWSTLLVIGAAFALAIVVEAWPLVRSAAARSRVANGLAGAAAASLHQEVLTRSMARTEIGVTVGILLGLCIVPLAAVLAPASVALTAPLLWGPMLGATVGYALAWRSAQAQARREARAAGWLEADLSARDPARYLSLRQRLAPWIIAAAGTLVVALLGPGAVGKPVGLWDLGHTVTLTWGILWTGAAVAVIAALLGTLLIGAMARAPRALPHDGRRDMAAATDEVTRRDAIAMTHLFALWAVIMALGEPLTLTAQTLHGLGPLPWLLSFVQFVLLVGAFLDTPTLLRARLFERVGRWTGRDRNDNRGNGARGNGTRGRRA